MNQEVRTVTWAVHGAIGSATGNSIRALRPYAYSNTLQLKTCKEGNKMTQRSLHNRGDAKCHLSRRRLPPSASEVMQEARSRGVGTGKFIRTGKFYPKGLKGLRTMPQQGMHCPKGNKGNNHAVKHIIML